MNQTHWRIYETHKANNRLQSFIIIQDTFKRHIQPSGGESLLRLRNRGKKNNWSALGGRSTWEKAGDRDAREAIPSRRHKAGDRDAREAIPSRRHKAGDRDAREAIPSRRQKPAKPMLKEPSLPRDRAGRPPRKKARHRRLKQSNHWSDSQKNLKNTRRN